MKLQHDAHVEAFDDYLVERFTKKATEPTQPHNGQGPHNPTDEDGEEPEYLYVIAKSDSIENLFWSNKIGWVDLDSADRFKRYHIEDLDLPMEGFWMSLERAMELELPDTMQVTPEGNHGS